MIRIIDYNTVLGTLCGQGLEILYYNSGSFGFPDGVEAKTLAWIGPADSTIRPEVRALTRQVSEPFTDHLVRGVLEVWRNSAFGAVWVMPRSHWAYELDSGSRDWLPGVLLEIGIDPATLAPLSTGAAIAFQPGESNQFESFLRHLLDNLSGSSDFQLAWPGWPLLCTVHHHRQLWWTTTDDAVYRNVARGAG